ncbi:4858_t:CDS:1, partial [Paraglomus occultum]
MTRRLILEEIINNIREQPETTPILALTKTYGKLWPHCEDARIEERKNEVFQHIAQSSYIPLQTNPQQAPPPFKIAILDSSFNPPTKAHVQLLLNSLTTSLYAPFTNEPVKVEFDACLLLYSTKNADKVLKEHDAGPVDRVLMMENVAEYLNEIAKGRVTKEKASADESNSSVDYKLAESRDDISNNEMSSTANDAKFHSIQNIAVGITNSSRFTDKSRALLSYCYPAFSPCLYFILGFDTLIRLFSPRYYTDISSSLSFLFSNSYTIYAERDINDKTVENEFWRGNKWAKEYADKIYRVEIDDD